MTNYTNKFESSILLKNIKSLTALNTKRSNTSYLFSFRANHLIYYPTPITTIYAWSFGFLAGMCLVTLMISGIFLMMQDTLQVYLAFSSVACIPMYDVYNNWFFNYIYLNIIMCVFFTAVYFFILRNLYCKFNVKIKKQLGCLLGVILFVFLIKLFLNSNLKFQLGFGLFFVTVLFFSWVALPEKNLLLKFQLQFFVKKHFILLLVIFRILYYIFLIPFDSFEYSFYEACCITTHCTPQDNLVVSPLCSELLNELKLIKHPSFELKSNSKDFLAGLLGGDGFPDQFRYTFREDSSGNQVIAFNHKESDLHKFTCHTINRNSVVSVIKEFKT